MEDKSGKDADVLSKVKWLYSQSLQEEIKRQEASLEMAEKEALELLEAAYQDTIKGIRQAASSIQVAYFANFSPVFKGKYSILVQAYLLGHLAERLRSDGFDVEVDQLSLDLTVSGWNNEV